jgi:hypothetical protein
MVELQFPPMASSEMQQEHALERFGLIRPLLEDEVPPVQIAQQQHLLMGTAR